MKVAERYASLLHADLAIVHKRRLKGQKPVEARDVVGDVDGRTCVLIDDMIDTASTLCAAAEQLIDHGASQSSRPPPTACSRAGHRSAEELGDLQGGGDQHAAAAAEKQIDKIEVLSVAGVIADAIDAVFEDTSVRDLRRRQPGLRSSTGHRRGGGDPSRPGTWLAPQGVRAGWREPGGPR